MTTQINLTPEQEIIRAHVQLDTMMVPKFDPNTGTKLNLPARIWAFADREGLTTLDERNPHA